jgi:hypothetical protein
MAQEKAMGSTGGPWKARGWDARSWQAPTARGAVRRETHPAGELRVIIVYLASVMALVLALMARGW